MAVVKPTYTHKHSRERTTTNNKKNTKIHRATQQLGRVWAVPRLCGFYPGICLTTEEKAQKNLSQGSSCHFIKHIHYCVLVVIGDLLDVCYSALLILLNDDI